MNSTKFKEIILEDFVVERESIRKTGVEIGFLHTDFLNNCIQPNFTGKFTEKEDCVILHSIQKNFVRVTLDRVSAIPNDKKIFVELDGIIYELIEFVDMSYSDLAFVFIIDNLKEKN